MWLHKKIERGLHVDKVIEVKQLQKSFGDVHAVQGLDFYVKKGTLFAFLGPNGAGKSTTIDIICTLLTPDSGEVLINGYRLGKEDDRIRSSIGVVFQDSVLDAMLTVRENLHMRGRLYGLKRQELKQAVEQAAQYADAMEFIDRPYGKLSGGQRRRADIARALVHTPEILFLDEPTTGLDPQTRKSVWNIIQKLQLEHGMTVFLTTHYMEEAANADYVTIIDHGQIAAKGTPAQLKEQYSSDYLKINPAAEIEKEVATTLNGLNVEYKVISGSFHIKLASTLEAVPIIQACEPYMTSFEVACGTMDDVFIEITGKEVRETC